MRWLFRRIGRVFLVFICGVILVIGYMVLLGVFRFLGLGVSWLRIGFSKEGFC